MFTDISYYLIFGKPLIMYLGIIVLLSFLITASIPILRKRGIAIPYEYHPLMAKISIALAIVHAILGITAYL